jgi:hypothetical protein
VTKRDTEKVELAELRESIEAGIAKSKRLLARSRELIGAAAQREPEPPAIKPEPRSPNPARR